jgi:hypothetical protein
MTTVAFKQHNPATQLDTVVMRVRVTRSRRHGRPRNIGKVAKIKYLPLETKKGVSSEATGA